MSGACVCTITGSSRADVECDCPEIEEHVAVFADAHAFLSRKGRAPASLATWLAQLDREGVQLSEDNARRTLMSQTTKYQPGQTGFDQYGTPFTVDSEGCPRSDYDGFPIASAFARPGTSPAVVTQRVEEERKRQEAEAYRAKVDKEARARLDEEYDEAKFEDAVEERMKELSFRA